MLQLLKDVPIDLAAAKINRAIDGVLVDSASSLFRTDAFVKRIGAGLLLRLAAIANGGTDLYGTSDG